MLEDLLRKTGLTEYEIKTYLALLRLGATGAVELARKSGVPFGKIYDVLYSLELKGFVKVVLGKPKSFSPANPSLVMEMLAKKKEDELISFKKELKDAEKELSKLSPGTKNPAVSIIRGEPNIKHARITEVIEAEKEYCGIISPDISTGPIPGLDKFLKEKIKKGVVFRWIENPADEATKNKIKAKIRAGAQIRLGKQTGYNLAIVDNKKLRLELNDPAQGRVSILVENPNLAKELKEFFDDKWRHSKPL